MSQNIKARFQVRKIEGKLARRVATPKANKQGKLLGGFEYEDQEVDAGWMVYFPSGASIHVWTQEEMDRQGFSRPAAHVDMDTGDIVATPHEDDYEKKAEMIANRKTSSVPHTL